jgi:hypothetical protein
MGLGSLKRTGKAVKIPDSSFQMFVFQISQHGLSLRHQLKVTFYSIILYTTVYYNEPRSTQTFRINSVHSIYFELVTPPI